MDFDWSFIEPIVYLVWLARRGRVRPRPDPDELASHRAQRQPAVGRRHGPRDPRDRVPAARQAVRRRDGHAVASGFNAVGWLVILAGIALGGGFGLYTARTVKMTAMPQLVSLFNAVGGGAAALIAIDDYLKFASAGTVPGLQVNVATVLDVVIGSITFTGSLIASGKLMGLKITPSRPVRIPGGQLVTLALALITIAGALFLWSGNVSLPVMGVILLAALIFGVTMTLPIGGADMPVVISLLNSFTGMAVAMAGFVLGNPVLIIGGALVGASGAILTKLMADAMNRSVLNIMIGGFGGGEGTASAVGASGGSERELGMDDAAIQLAYASSVIVVPGYGLAVAQAQHAVRELAEILEARGVDVKYAIHPVAGRMPGHMNVLLAEANVPYPQLKEMEDINPEFDRCDVALVIGANDVTNPAARKPGSPVSGMPILDVDHAKNIIVMKRVDRSRVRGHRQRALHEPQDGDAVRGREAGPRGPDRGGEVALASVHRDPAHGPGSAGAVSIPGASRADRAYAWTMPSRKPAAPARAAPRPHGRGPPRSRSSDRTGSARRRRCSRSRPRSSAPAVPWSSGREVVRDNPLGINEGATGEAQLWVLVSQIRQELELARKADVLATDRGVMDNYAYYLRSCGGEDEYETYPLVRRWSRTYDLVVRLLPDVALQADGVRSTNDAFRDEVEAILDRVLPGARAGGASRHAPRVGDHEPVRLVRGRGAARRVDRRHGLAARPLALAAATTPPGARSTGRPRRRRRSADPMSRPA